MNLSHTLVGREFDATRFKTRADAEKVARQIASTAIPRKITGAHPFYYVIEANGGSLVRLRKDTPTSSTRKDRFVEVKYTLVSKVIEATRFETVDEAEFVARRILSTNIPRKITVDNSIHYAVEANDGRLVKLSKAMTITKFRKVRVVEVFHTLVSKRSEATRFMNKDDAGIMAKRISPTALVRKITGGDPIFYVIEDNGGGMIRLGFDISTSCTSKEKIKKVKHLLVNRRFEATRFKSKDDAKYVARRIAPTAIPRKITGEGPIHYVIEANGGSLVKLQEKVAITTTYSENVQI